MCRCVWCAIHAATSGAVSGAWLCRGGGMKPQPLQIRAEDKLKDLCVACMLCLLLLRVSSGVATGGVGVLFVGELTEHAASL